MPLGDTIGTIADFAVEIIKLINPSELERVKKEIRKREEELRELEENHAKRLKRLKEALASGDTDAVIAILDE